MVAVAADVVEVRWLRAWSIYSNVKCCADDYDHYDHRREAQESPDQKLKTAIIKFGEVVRFAVPQARSSYRDATQDAEQELPQLADKLHSSPPRPPPPRNSLHCRCRLAALFNFALCPACVAHMSCGHGRLGSV